MKVPFLDLKSHYVPMMREINRAIEEVMEGYAHARGWGAIVSGFCQPLPGAAGPPMIAAVPRLRLKHRPLG